MDRSPFNPPRNAHEALNCIAQLHSAKDEYPEGFRAYLREVLSRDEFLRRDLLALLTEVMVLAVRVEDESRQHQEAVEARARVTRARRRARRDKGFRAFMGAVTGEGK